MDATISGTREELLEVLLQQSVATIEFLHSCLTEPPREGSNGGFVYAYPEQTLRFLEELGKAVPERDWCVHSKVDPDCPSCMDGVHSRAVMAHWREQLDTAQAATASTT